MSDDLRHWRRAQLKDHERPSATSSVPASRGVAMQLTGHKTEAVYRRHAIVSQGDPGAGSEKLGALAVGTTRGQKGAAVA